MNLYTHAHIAHVHNHTRMWVPHMGMCVHMPEAYVHAHASVCCADVCTPAGSARTQMCTCVFVQSAESCTCVVPSTYAWMCTDVCTCIACACGYVGGCGAQTLCVHTRVRGQAEAPCGAQSTPSQVSPAGLRPNSSLRSRARTQCLWVWPWLDQPLWAPFVPGMRGSGRAKTSPFRVVSFETYLSLSPMSPSPRPHPSAATRPPAAPTPLFPRVLPSPGLAFSDPLGQAVCPGPCRSCCRTTRDVCQRLG